RPTGEDVAIVVVMPDGESVPMTSDEYRERSEHRVEHVAPPGRRVEGLALVLDPEGERAIREAAADPGASDPRIVGYSERPLGIDPRAEAVRDLVESKRLVARAEAVLGTEAVDEILCWLPDMTEPPSQAA
ncbi:hypothetical protein MKK88_30850, partial [Methylobacterium sp. E-005]|uniref:hypothetical protein n=1 Tax=Methylobacterium sp. E-005 TaxID=2836549 RepID=UPI001FB8BAE3